ncbi:winged helix-turn-helix transcriptional regulator [Roseovarius sp. C7]|uniref:winged helix-turn-helix transcriptional regulator n=1 Tax=Roseovarius sp. C7 TaxID=3398643 RepID=UPI0039F6563B
MAHSSYRQFCPVAMAAEILCRRWMMLVIRELVAGSTRFNDLRRGVPKMSRSLLATRLRELEDYGVIERHVVSHQSAVHEYRLTDAGRDLLPVVEAVGNWGQKWVESRVSLDNLDASLLMWDMHRNLDPSPLPKRRVLIQFTFNDLSPRQANYWLVVMPSGDVDLCRDDPGFELDLLITTDLRSMTMIWMGLAKVADLRERLSIDGDTEMAAQMQTWLGLSPFARVERKVS